MKEKIKEYKMLAKLKAKAFLDEKRHLKGEEKRALKKKYREEVSAWKASLADMDSEERKAQKKGFRAFKRRKNRTLNIILWILFVLILFLLLFEVYVIAVVWPYIQAYGWDKLWYLTLLVCCSTFFA